MKVKALVSFSGAFSMYEGEVRECSDGSTLQDLLQIKYVEEVTEEPIKENEIKKELEDLRRQIKALEDTKEEKPKNPKKDVESSGDKKSKSDNK